MVINNSFNVIIINYLLTVKINIATIKVLNLIADKCN
jgi:hypothetical protein